jgi:CubicO group peptidase (beta-lactamase class C family)
MQMHLLAERGALSLDDPVAACWPEYASHGKDGTVRHVLAHWAGVPYASGSEYGDTLTMARWDRAVRQAQQAPPRWPAGQVVAYHPMTYGFILGEVIGRVAGQAVASQVTADIFRALGLGDTFLGIPAAGISTTARDLAHFYQMLLGGGRLDGPRILSPRTVAEASRA